MKEHHRKERKEKKKNPDRFKKRDPGIPNSWPFKLQLIQRFCADVLAADLSRHGRGASLSACGLFLDVSPPTLELCSPLLAACCCDARLGRSLCR